MRGPRIGLICEVRHIATNVAKLPELLRGSPPLSEA